MIATAKLALSRQREGAAFSLAPAIQRPTRPVSHHERHLWRGE